MDTLSIALPPQRAQAAFHRRRWDQVLADPVWSRFEGRIETDRYGRVLMSPPPAPQHGSYQSEIAFLLRSRQSVGRVITECPISTADGVKAADVAWASAEALQGLGNRSCFQRAPELCVEVVSPGNTPAEIREKVALYFDAGAHEVWLCEPTGRIQFLSAPTGRAMRQSRLCPDFPARVRLP